MGDRTCSVDGCDGTMWARGWCGRHYQRWRAHGEPNRPPKTPAERFWEKVDKGPHDSGCWLWLGATNSWGYGNFYVDRHWTSAHRFALDLLRGPVPSDEEAGYRVAIDHLCRVRLCVNPDHLEIVSNRENILRGFGASAPNVEKIACPAEHPYDAENTYIDPRGKRGCRTCRREQFRQFRLRRA